MLSHLLYQTAWHGGVLYVGFFFAGPDVALYAICLRLAELVALPGVIVPFLGQPIVAASDTARSHRHLSAAMQSLSTLALVPSALFLTVFWFFGEFFLETFFGAAYAHGGLILFLVALGRCIDIAAGSAAQSVLLIKGNRKAVLIVNAATLLVLMLLLPLFASRYALDGVGMALSIYFALRSVILASVAMILQRTATWPTVSTTKLRSGLNYRRDALG
jgi:O-antigen/teichoic acid export membrane protein